MTEFFSQPDDLGELRSSDLHASLGETLSAQAQEALFGATRTLFRNFEYKAARGDAMPVVPEMGQVSGEDPTQTAQPDPDISIDDAKSQVKQAGLEGQFQLPDQPTIKQPVLDLMMRHEQERRDLQATLSRGPQGFVPDALGFMTSVGAGLIDPVGDAAFMIPVLGEARLGKIMATAGESLVGRAALRAGVGAAQGAVGTAVLQPSDWWLHTNDGQDYTMADALHSIVLGAAQGGLFHAGLGFMSDVNARRKGMPLEGSPEDLILRGLMKGTKVPERTLAEPAVDIHEIPGVSPQALPERPHPAEVLADLPPPAREDVTRAAIADVINDRPVRAAELLEESAKEDPRIAESTAPYFDQVVTKEIQSRQAGGNIPIDAGFASDIAASSEPVTVRISANHDRFLDWNRPLKDQPDVLARFREVVAPEDREQFDRDVENGILGQGAYRYYAGADATAASKNLLDAGIPGIRYRDSGSRDVTGSGEKATSNFVVFDDKHIKITQKNGEEVGLHEFKAARGLSAEERKWPALPKGARVAGSGDHGPMVEGLEGRWQEPAEWSHALGWLREAQTGEIVGILVHPEIDGPIDLVFGDRRYGVEHVDQQRQGDMDALPTLWSELKVSRRDSKYVELQSERAGAVVSLDFKGDQKRWLLTFWRRKPRPAEETVRGPGDYEAAAQSTTPPGDKNLGPEEAAGKGIEPGLDDRADDLFRPEGQNRADWSRLQGDKVDPAERELIEASQEAAKAPEPPQEPENVVSAAEAAARDADQLLEDIRPQLTEEERKAFDDALEAAARDKELQETLVRDGTACLLAATAGEAQ